MKNFIAFIFFVLINENVNSQSYVDLLKVSAGTTSYNKFDTSSSKTKINDLLVDLTFPVKINKQVSLISGIIYETIEARLFAEGSIKSFGSTTLKLGANKEFNERWSATLLLLPKISSDYSSLNKKDFQQGAIGWVKYKKKENLIYKAGLYYNSELFGAFFVPMLGLYYTSADSRLEANVMLPLQADINYKLHSVLNVGFNFNGQIRSYHLNEVTPTQKSSYLSKSSNEIFLYVKFNFTKELSFQTKLGYSVARTYRVYDHDDKVSFGIPAKYFGKERSQLNTDFSDGALLQFVLLYRFHLNKK